LGKKKINLILNKPVQEIKEKEIIFKDNSKLYSDLIVWVAGVQPLVLKTTPNLYIDGITRIPVENTLQLKAYRNVYIGGDQALVLDNSTSKPYPLLAQIAKREGSLIGENIKRDLRGKSLKIFKYKIYGMLLSLGKNKATGILAGFKFNGFIGRIVWQVIYFTQIPGNKRKVKIALKWFKNFFKF
jgi:NADH dehydrogenase